MTEAQKCLSNLLYNSSAIQRMCCINSCIPGLMCRLKTFKDPDLPHLVKYFDMRLLFLLTAFCGDIRWGRTSSSLRLAIDIRRRKVALMLGMDVKENKDSLYPLFLCFVLFFFIFILSDYFPFLSYFLFLFLFPFSCFFLSLIISLSFLFISLFF